MRNWFTVLSVLASLTVTATAAAETVFYETCWDLEGGVVAEEDPWGFGCPPEADLKWAYAPGPTSNAVFFWNEQTCDAAVVEEPYASVTAADLPGLTFCDYINDPVCDGYPLDPAYRDADTTISFVVTTQEGNTWKVAYLAENPDFTVTFQASLLTCAPGYPGCGTCSDGVKNQGEEATDCGGPCAACPPPTCVTAQRGLAGAVGGVQDAFASVDFPSWQTGTEPAIKTGVSGLGNCCHQGFVQFDLGAIPAGATVDSATLSLYMNWSNSVGIIDVHRAAVGWTEALLSKDSAGPNPFDPLIEGSISVSTGVVGLKSMDLTGLVQEWLDGSQPNQGVVLTESGGAGHTFDSSENGTLARRPKLQVCYLP